MRSVKFITAKDIDHFTENKTGFVILVWTGKDLSVGQRVVIALVVFDVIHGDGLDPPGMIDQDLCVYAEGL